MNSFLTMVGSNAIIATLLAVGVALLGRIWKNPAAMHVLWLVVLLKLFTPPLVTTNVPLVGSWLPPLAPAGVKATIANDIDETTIAIGSTISEGSDSADSRVIARKKTRETFSRGIWSLSELVAVVWILGSVGMAVRYAILIYRFAGLFRQFEPATFEIRMLIEETAQRLGLARVPSVWMTSGGLPPLVWSVGIHPHVILPLRLFARLDLSAQSTVIAHELVHVSRRDHLVRLLELAAATIFWWHPVVWWASSKLRDLEEQCCDSRVLELTPQHSRTYALALIETLDFLSEQPRLYVPLPTAVYSTGSLSRRIRMLTHTSVNRLNCRSAILVAALASFPLVVALGIAQEKPGVEQKKTAAEQVKKPAVAVLKGKVRNEAGQALAGARVRVAIPAAEMRRFVNSGSDQKLFEAISNDDGEYRVEVPGIGSPTPVSIDAMQPGYRRLSGTLMSGGDNTRPKVWSGLVVEQDLKLVPALYFKGVVVDENDKPIGAVEIGANANTDRWSGGVERTTSNESGEFELFNYSAEPFELRNQKTKGVVMFSHSNYVGHTIADIYNLAENERTTMRIVLAKGHQLSGVVRDKAGKPVPTLMVKAISRGNYRTRKAVLTDANGRFSLQGFPAGRTEVSVRAVDIQQKVQLPIELDSDKNDLDVRLEAMNVPADLKTVNVLGMKLTDATPEMRTAYNLFDAGGALILDPGRDSERLRIGKIEHGYNFWMVGNKRIGSVREFVQQILAEADKEDLKVYSIRVVYSLSSLEFDGTNTQYLSLTQADIEQLKGVLEQLPTPAK